MLSINQLVTTLVRAQLQIIEKVSVVTKTRFTKVDTSFFFYWVALFLVIYDFQDSLIERSMNRLTMQSFREHIRFECHSGLNSMRGF